MMWSHWAIPVAWLEPSRETNCRTDDRGGGGGWRGAGPRSALSLKSVDLDHKHGVSRSADDMPPIKLAAGGGRGRFQPICRA